MKRPFSGVLACFFIGILLLSAAGCEKQPVLDAGPDGESVAIAATEAEPIEAEPAETKQNEAEPDETDSPDAEPVITPAYSGSMDFREAPLPPFHKTADVFTCFDFDERYVLFVAYDFDEASLRYVRTDVRLAILDKKEGRFLAEEYRICETPHEPPYSIHYEDGYCVLHAVYLNRETMTYSVGEAYRISEENGVFCVEKTTREAFPRHTARCSSPDGRYIVYETMTDGYGSGGILLKESGKEAAEVLTNQMPGPDTKGRGHTPVGFIDNTRFLYIIEGWEWPIGYGIYDAAEGTAREWENNHLVIGYDRAAQKLITLNYTQDWYEVTLSGEQTFVFHDENLNYGRGSLSWYEGYWLRITPDRLEFLSPDRTQTVAVLEAPEGSEYWYYHPYQTSLFLYENTLTLVR